MRHIYHPSINYLWLSGDSIGLRDWRNIDFSVRELDFEPPVNRYPLHFSDSTLIALLSPIESEDLFISASMYAKEISPIVSPKLGEFRRFFFERDQDRISLSSWTSRGTSISANDLTRIVNRDKVFYILTSDLDSFSPSCNSWIDLGTPPHILTATAMTILNDCIYFFGGQASNKAVKYDLNLKEWFSLPDLPIFLSHATAVNDGNLIYIFGGFAAGDNLNFYKFENGFYSIFTTSPINEYICTGWYSEGKIYVLYANNKTYKFDLVSNRWIETTPTDGTLSSPRSAFEEESKVAIITNEPGNVAWVYDALIDATGFGGNLPKSQNSINAIDFDEFWTFGDFETNLIWFTGLTGIPAISYPTSLPSTQNFGLSNNYEKCYLFDLTNNQILSLRLGFDWEVEKSNAFSSPNTFEGAFLLGNKFFVFITSGQKLEVWSFDLIKKETSKEFELDYRTAFGSCQIGEVIFVLGGVDESGNFLYEFTAVNLINQSETTLGNFPFPQRNSFLAEFNGYIYVYGGQRTNGQWFKDIYRYSIQDDNWHLVNSDQYSRVGGSFVQVGSLAIRITDKFHFYSLKQKGKYLGDFGSLSDSPPQAATFLQNRILTINNYCSVKIIPGIRSFQFTTRP